MTKKERELAETAYNAVCELESMPLRPKDAERKVQYAGDALSVLLKEDDKNDD